jgi:argininosuccinate lyase
MKGTRDEAPLWSGRFSEPPAAEAAALGRSLGFDVRLAPYDVQASIAHVRALRDAGLLVGDDAARLEGALRSVGEAIAGGTFAFHPADEDVHSAIERGVTDLVGDLGGRLHAARSRNDLVMTDLRLWLLAAHRRIEGGAVRLLGALVAHGREHAESVMPGTTHGRAAQPVTLGHHLLAHAWALARDLDRFAGWRDRASESPLGAGALATSTLGLDPTETARRLGFDGAFANSIDAVSDRDVVQEFLGHAVTLSTHVSRLAADVVRFTDEALGWASLSEAYATGSSMMPQKRNPDVAELARAKAGRVLGDLVAVSSALHALPLGYHRDLQEDKEAVFDAADTLDDVLPALAGCVETMTFHPEAMRAAAAAPGLFATDLAEALVAAGVPFREAHRRVGELLRRLEAEDLSFSALSPDDWATLGLPDGADLLDADRAVRARATPGGPSPDSVLRQAEALDRRLADRASLLTPSTRPASSRSRA